MKKKLFLLFTALIFIVYRAIYYDFTIEKGIKIIAVDMYYACNDCYRHHEILEINKGIKIKRFLNKELPFKYVNRQIEVELDKKIEKCGICYHIQTYGDLTYSLIYGYMIRVEKAEPFLKDKNCCHSH